MKQRVAGSIIASEKETPLTAQDAFCLLMLCARRLSRCGMARCCHHSRPCDGSSLHAAAAIAVRMSAHARVAMADYNSRSRNSEINNGPFVTDSTGERAWPCVSSGARNSCGSGLPQAAAAVRGG